MYRSLGDSLVFIAQVADLREVIIVAFQLDLFLLVDEETIGARAGKRLTRPDVIFLAGHCEATSNLLVVDIIARVQHHKLPLGFLLAHYKNSLGLALVHHDGLITRVACWKHNFARYLIHLMVELEEVFLLNRLEKIICFHCVFATGEKRGWRHCRLL